MVFVVAEAELPVLGSRQKGTAVSKDGAGKPDGVGGKVGREDGTMRETGTGGDDCAGATGEAGGGSSLMLPSDLSESLVGDGRRDVGKLSSDKPKEEQSLWDVLCWWRVGLRTAWRTL